YVKGECVHLKSALCITILIGMPIIYLFGTYWMSLNQGIGIYDAFKVSVIPFVLGDVVKCVIASLVAVRLTKRVNQSVFRGQLVNE
ncbi:MAG: biotin transporter BioY, partial [Turicibacter sanguinis]